MAKLGLSLLIILSICLYNTGGTAESAVANSTDFIKASCRATRYPALCFQCLSGYASEIQQSDQQLAQIALSVSLDKAKSAAGFVYRLAKVEGIRPREYLAVKDCIANMGNSMDRLNQSMEEFGNMVGTAGQDFTWHISNVQTWVSAALTDQNTCLDGFAGSAMEGNVKATISPRVVNVAQVTSNALALVNRFATRHRAAAAATKIP